MNKAEQYVYAVYRTNSFSKAAKKMFVTQPALSATIIKLEKELGYSIFNRSPSISLTKEGEAYIDYLNELVELEHKLNRYIQSLHNTATKVLSIGWAGSSASPAVPKLCKEFNLKFPDVDIKIDMGGYGNYRTLFDKLDSGTLDFVVTANLNSPKYDTVTLWKEKYFLVIRKDYPNIEPLRKHSLSHDEISSGIYSEEKELSDWSLFKKINIFKPGPSRKGWKIFADFFSEASYKKFTIHNFLNLDMHCSLMEEGLGAAMLSQSTIIEKGYNSQDFYCFAIAAEDNLREVVLAYKKDSSLSKYAKEFIEISKKRFPAEKTIGELLSDTYSLG